MRPLDEDETTQVLEKLHKFVGSNLKHLIERQATEGLDSKPGGYCFRLHKQRVYYSGLARITDNTPQYQGVVVYSMSDIPLGFGLAAKSTQDCRKLDPTDIVTLHQSDIGEYLRMEDEL
ncbi:hypothetical protein AXG93_3296s1090 [Marchantia polymorpha subsp. ruderalis]|uniref:PUA domain-containing protein n=1 Tax=Marchantia polymorpha subsp. ruderalis TaxID=1480154 RepID=A0A176WJH3_MARPO|nr:hypothetical protein AXG93_3296s1090 [Marchantia polymorpha subsp. ruderalis]